MAGLAQDHVYALAGGHEILRRRGVLAAHLLIQEVLLEGHFLLEMGHVW